MTIKLFFLELEIRLTLKLFSFQFEYAHINKGRIPGCQSRNHTECRGELWTCERCGKTVCWEEGSTDLPEICDGCWVGVRIHGATWDDELMD